MFAKTQAGLTQKGLLTSRSLEHRQSGRSVPKDVPRNSLLHHHVGEIGATPVLGLRQIHDSLLTWALARQGLDKCEHAGPNELGPVGRQYKH